MNNHIAMRHEGRLHHPGGGIWIRPVGVGVCVSASVYMHAIRQGEGLLSSLSELFSPEEISGPWCHGSRAQI